MEDAARTAYERYLLLRGQQWKAALEEFDAGVAAEILRGMRDLRRAVDARIADLDLSDAADALDRERLARLEAWLDSVGAAASSLAGGLSLEAGVQAALASATAAAAALSLDGACSAVRDAGLTREQIMVWYRDGDALLAGHSFRGMLDGMAAGFRSTVLDSLRTTAAMGEGYTTAVNRLLVESMEAGYSLAVRDAVTIARTAVQAGAVAAMDAVYEANGDLLAGWRWVAKLDSRTCLQCGALDGKIFRLGEGPRMPAHPRCRCLRQPITKKSASLGIPDADVQRLSRTWVEREAGTIDLGGRKIVASGQTDRWFGEWFSALPAARQDAIAGPSRARALREGRLSWSDVTGADGELRTLKSLGIERERSRAPRKPPLEAKPF